MGNKAILMSIQPKWVAKILNGDKTIEVRKKFPKDYVGWVYIYCTKGKLPIMEYINRGVHNIITDNRFDKSFKYYLNGKVVARFWCNKVEEIYWQPNFGLGNDSFYTHTLADIELEQKSCLKAKDFINYLGCENGYAIHISKLEVFDKPRELKEFKVKKAPQSYMFIEGE